MTKYVVHYTNCLYKKIVVDANCMREAMRKFESGEIDLSTAIVSGEEIIDAGVYIDESATGGDKC